MLCYAHSSFWVASVLSSFSDRGFHLDADLEDRGNFCFVKDLGSRNKVVAAVLSWQLYLLKPLKQTAAYVLLSLRGHVWIMVVSAELYDPEWRRNQAGCWGQILNHVRRQAEIRCFVLQSGIQSTGEILFLQNEVEHIIYCLWYEIMLFTSTG